MEFIQEFISQYGTTILYAVLTAIAGYLGIVVKRIYEKYINDKTKQAVAKTVVQAVEQIYNDLHGDEKLNMALQSMSEMLAEKNIHISELEMRMLIESAVAEFNEAFKKNQSVVSEQIPGDATEMRQIAEYKIVTVILVGRYFFVAHNTAIRFPFIK